MQDQRYDFGSSSGAFPAHTDNIRRIKFNPANPKHIYMASYDGRFRLADLDKLMFGPVCCFFVWNFLHKLVVEIRNFKTIGVNNEKVF